MLDDKGIALAARRGALEQEQARLLSDAEPGCDPEMLRERMPEALAFIREWVRAAEGDELVLPAQALEARIEVAPGEAQIRVEVPLIEPGKGGKFCYHCTNMGMTTRSCERGCARFYVALSF